MAVYNAKGGRPRLRVDIEAITADVKDVLEGSGESITAVALKHSVSRAWIHRNGYPSLGHIPDRSSSVNHSST